MTGPKLSNLETAAPAGKSSETKQSTSCSASPGHCLDMPRQTWVTRGGFQKQQKWVRSNIRAHKDPAQ